MRLEEPAISAWHRLRPETSPALRSELLRAEERGTLVYRLVPEGPGDEPVIAKRCRWETARIEQSVYGDILPNLPLSSVRYYGSSPEADGQFWWLFLEDVTGHPEYRPQHEEHRRAAARWLGIMNTEAMGLPAVRDLPDRGPGHYRRLLESVIPALQAMVGQPVRDAAEHGMLEATLRQCERLASRWDRLASACDRVPSTLVHGDFITKNVRVRREADGLVLLPFDWEKAGWGTPAEDISRVDLSIYRDTVRKRWPHVGLSDLDRVATVGKVFRSIVYLEWLAPELSEGPTDRAMSHVRRCEAWLADLVREAAWER